MFSRLIVAILLTVSLFTANVNVAQASKVAIKAEDHYKDMSEEKLQMYISTRIDGAKARRVAEVVIPFFTEHNASRGFGIILERGLKVTGTATCKDVDGRTRYYIGVLIRF